MREQKATLKPRFVKWTDRETNEGKLLLKGALNEHGAWPCLPAPFRR
jgi:hypothetical protein